jgi:hypothetical protein
VIPLLLFMAGSTLVLSITADPFIGLGLVLVAVGAGWITITLSNK